MTRAAHIVSRALMIAAYPAYYSACVLLVLWLTGAARVSPAIIIALAVYAPAAILIDSAVRIFTASQLETEPGGSPGTES